MSDLVENPEDKVSHDQVFIKEPHHEKTCRCGFGSRLMVRVLIFLIYEVEGLYCLCSENKVDELGSYHAANQLLCFCIFRRQVFSWQGSYNFNFIFQMIKHWEAFLPEAKAIA